jgi:hypothetical protein
VSQTLAVAARELRERWRLLPAGLIVGLAPFLTPAFGLRAEQVPVVAILLAVLLGATAAFVAGGGMLARDTAEGRLAFLFSRPVSWPAIWGGKWLAAVVLVFGSALLTLLPVILVYPPPSPAGTWQQVFLGPNGSALFVVLLFLAIGLSNFNATAFRSRSAWLALDLVLLVLAIRLVVVWVGPLFALHVFRPWATGWWIGLLAVPALALLLASVPQVGIGRTDLRRAHRALSVAFWALVFVALVGAGLRLAWARAASPADLTAWAGGSADPSGRWLYIAGESSRGGSATFLVDADGDRHVPLGVRHAWEWGLSPGMAFSAEGRSGIVLRQGPEHSAFLHVDLAGAEPLFTEVELESSPPSEPRTLFALSGSGATAVLAHQRGTSLFEVPSGRRVATVTHPPGWWPAAVRFRGEHTVRAWLFPRLGLPFAAHPPAEMKIVDLAVDADPAWTSAPLETVVAHVQSWPRLARPDARGDRVLTQDGALRLRDGATGELIAILTEGPSPASAVFLGDGRIVVGTAEGTRTSLRSFSSEGAALGEVVLDRQSAELGVASEVAPGRVAIGLGRVPGRFETVVVDVDEGRVVETLPALGHLKMAWMSEPSPTPGLTRHFFVEDGAIVRRDFATGEQRVVAGKGADPGERLSP